MVNFFSKRALNFLFVFPALTSTLLLSACLTTATMRSETEYMPQEVSHGQASSPSARGTTVPNEDKIDVAMHDQPRYQPVVARPIVENTAPKNQVVSRPVPTPQNTAVKSIQVKPAPAPINQQQNTAPSDLPALKSNKKQTLSTY